MNREKLEAEIKKIVWDEDWDSNELFIKKILTAIDAYSDEIIGEDETDHISVMREVLSLARNDLRKEQRIRANIHPSATHGKEGEV